MSRHFATSVIVIIDNVVMHLFLTNSNARPRDGANHCLRRLHSHAYGIRPDSVPLMPTTFAPSLFLYSHTHSAVTLTLTLTCLKQSLGQDEYVCQAWLRSDPPSRLVDCKAGLQTRRDTPAQWLWLSLSTLTRLSLQSTWAPLYCA